MTLTFRQVKFGAAVPVPDDSDSSIELIPDGAYGPSPDDDRPPYPMEVHTEPPPPGGPPDAPGAKQPFANPDQIMQPPPHVPQAAPQPIVPLPKHPHFPLPGVMRLPSPRNVPLTRSSVCVLMTPDQKLNCGFLR